jgi:large subunit ribosomal protein L15
MREIIKKIPKLRGHGVNRARTVNSEKVLPTVINVAALEAGLKAGAAVNPKTLVAAGLVGARRKKAPAVKILGTGELSIKLIVTDCVVSKTAKEKIEKAGGTVA